MIKVGILINGRSLKKTGDVEHDLFNYLRRVSFKGLLDNAEAYVPKQPFFAINTLPLNLFTLADVNISK
jgi:hypothetical protein